MCGLRRRILGGGALRGGMPWWKYVANRFLTFVENLLLGAKLSDYHTGYRAFTRKLLERLPLAQVIALGCAIGEVTCPARYLPEASSINFRRSERYGPGRLFTALRFGFARWGWLALLLKGPPMRNLCNYTRKPAGPEIDYLTT